MVTIFSTRILRVLSEDKNSILDAGCGEGMHALYLARRDTSRIVYGYDVSTDSIEKAIAYKEKHHVDNVHFSVASHDDFIVPGKMDMIYTAESLVGEEEEMSNPCDLARTRLLKFRESLNPGGVYIITWAATEGAKEMFIEMAEGCGLKFLENRQGIRVSSGFRSYEDLYKIALIFERS